MFTAEHAENAERGKTAKPSKLSAPSARSAVHLDMSKPIIQVENLSKQYRIGASEAAYGTFRESLSAAVKAPFPRFGRNGNAPDETIWALKDVSFEVLPGEVVGIIGRNGAGKSTLLKILSRITEPTTGSVKLYGRVASLLEVGTGFHPELTGRENIYLNGAILGMARREIERKFDEIVSFAEVEKFIDTPVKRYSSGMYLRLAFAVAAHLDPEILMVDEVLAVGDASFQKKCLGKMGEVAHKGRTVLFVSHNMSAVNALCPKSILLHQGQVSTTGTSTDVISQYGQLSAARPEATVDFSMRTVERYGAKKFATWNSIILKNSQGKPTSNLCMGESASFLLDLDIREPSDDFEIGVAINNLQDVSLHYLVSGWEGFSSIPSRGSHQIEVGLPYVYLFPGDYQVNIWIALRGEFYDDAIHEALRFSVEEGRVNDHNTYFSRFSKNTQVYIPATWKLSASSAPSGWE